MEIELLDQVPGQTGRRFDKDANEVLNAGLHLMEQHEQQAAAKV
ncbi:hypothetical protein [Candidatus Thiodictyon syntrophicum]|jgi:hypothetical protein|nr:hypothetical protein [Candidatus Thiodictyon syntrophicum]